MDARQRLDSVRAQATITEISNAQMEGKSRMAVQHTNRRGQVYTLYEGRPKKGSPNYFFARRPKPGVKPLESIPEGYEIHESPEPAQVFLRRIKPRLVTDAEVETVRRAVRELAGLRIYIVDPEEKAIVVWTPMQDPGELEQFLQELGSYATPDLMDKMTRGGTFHAMMRFVLLDGERRLFRADRWCFRGRIDNWIELEASGKLGPLLQRFIPHLGKESFYDLPYLA